MDDELTIIDEQRVAHPLGSLQPAVTLDDIAVLRTAVNDVYVDDVLKRWLVELVRATRVLDDVAMGASVRGSLALERGVRAWALLHGRDYVVPVDVEQLFVPVISHRLVFRSGFLARARASGWAEAIEDFRRQCLELAPVPGSEEDPLFEGPPPPGVSRTRRKRRVPGAPLAKEPSERRAGQYSTYGHRTCRQRRQAEAKPVTRLEPPPARA